MKQTIIFLFIFHFYSLSAQTLSGRILDEYGNPLHAAAIVQLNPDSMFVQAAISDSLGKYELPLLNKLPGIIKVTHFAYEDYFMNYEPSSSNLKNPDIILKPKTFLLDEVVIRANPPSLKRMADHFSFQVANTDLIKSNNTWNVLKFTPFLKVDDFTGIEMIGKGPITVYINGRKNRFTGNSLKSYLESLPAEEILHIEIITNPNSTSRAEDASGAINIVLRKNEMEGLKGSLSATDRQSDYKNYWDGNAFLNYKKSKIDFTVNAFASQNKNHQVIQTKYDYLNENTTTNALNTTERNDLNYGLKANMDYHLSDNQVFGLMLSASLGDNKNNGLNHNRYQSVGHLTPDSVSKTARNNQADLYQLNANLNYYIKLNNNRGILSADIDFLRYQNKQNRLTDTDLSNPEKVFIGLIGSFGQKQNQIITNGSAKVDYEFNRPEIIKFKTGLEVYTTRSKADELFSNLQTNRAASSQNNKFIYTETVSAGYVQFSKEWDKLSATLGARVEYSYGNGEVKEEPAKNFTRNNWNVFPSATLNYSPSPSHTLSLSFSSGIRRPEFTLLNPFRIYTSETTYRENNPFLKNMKTYFINLTYVLKDKYIVELNRFSSRNAWSLFKIPVPNTNTTRELFDNYGNSHITSLNFMWNESLLKGVWYVNYSIGGYYGVSNGRIEETPIEISNYVPTVYLSNSFLISRKWNIRAMLTYYFMGKEKLASVDRSPFHDLGIRLNKTFGNLTLSMGINDILNLKIKEFYHTDSYDYKSARKNNRRNIWLSIVYNWGNQKVKGARNRRTNTDINRRIN